MGEMSHREKCRSGRNVAGRNVAGRKVAGRNVAGRNVSQGEMSYNRVKCDRVAMVGKIPTWYKNSTYGENFY